MASSLDSLKPRAALARCWVASPQSTSHVTPLGHWIPAPETFLVRDGACAAVPKIVTFAGPDMVDTDRQAPASRVRFRAAVAAARMRGQSAQEKCPQVSRVGVPPQGSNC